MSNNKSNNDAEVIEEEHGVEGINDEVSDNQSEAGDFYDDTINDEVSVTNECEANDLNDDTINNSDSECTEDSYNDEEEFRGDNVVCRVPKFAQME